MRRQKNLCIFKDTQRLYTTNSRLCDAVRNSLSHQKLIPERMWYTVDVLTCAAPNLRDRPRNERTPGSGYQRIEISEDKLRELHEKRLRRVADIAVEHGAQVLILGAFGCGAFQNPPEVVAQAMKTVVEEYLHCFQNIEIAVYCSPRDNTNHRVFSEMFQTFQRHPG